MIWAKVLASNMERGESNRDRALGHTAGPMARDQALRPDPVRLKSRLWIMGDQLVGLCLGIDVDEIATRRDKQLIA